MPDNVFAAIPAKLPAELIETLVDASSVRIERIVSAGHSTPEGDWYDQSESEWVIVLRGAATLVFADDPEPLELAAGDYVCIPAHRRHRVASTAADEATVWLAVFFKDSR